MPSPYHPFSAETHSNPYEQATSLGPKLRGDLTNLNTETVWSQLVEPMDALGVLVSQSENDKNNESLDTVSFMAPDSDQWAAALTFNSPKPILHIHTGDTVPAFLTGLASQLEVVFDAAGK